MLALHAVGPAQERKPPELRPFPQIDRVLLAARQDGQQGNLTGAETLYAEAQEQSRELHYADGEARALTGLGACQFGRFSYSKALQSFLRARDLASRIDNPFLAGTIAGNIASLYIQLNSWVEAVQEIDESIHFLSAAKEKQAPKSLLGAYIIKAEIFYHQADAVEGRQAVQHAISLSRELNDRHSEAFAWNKLGEFALFVHDYAEADRSLRKAAQIETETHDDYLPVTRLNQASATLHLGQPRKALEILQETMANPGPALSFSPPYEEPQIRGQILTALSRTDEALESLHRAVQRADEWRAAALPGDVSSTATVMLLQGVYANYITLAAATALSRHNEALARSSLEVLAHSRAANLREQATVYLHRQERLPPEYYDLLRQLESAQAKALAEPGGTDATQQIRARLAVLQDRIVLKEDEFSKDRERNLHQKSLRDIQQSLGAEDLLLSFSLGEEGGDPSYLWATTGDSVTLYAIGKREPIETAARHFEGAVRSRSDAAGSGQQLSSLLFSQLPSKIQAKKHWLLVPDGQLLDGMPWAALPDPHAALSSIIDRRDIRVLPTELFIGARKRTIPGTFVGVGDPIYNQADPRLAAARKETRKPARPIRLARLAGSEPEMESASRAWKPQTTVLLTAGHATLANLQSTLEQQPPGVLHFAVHVLSPDQHPEQAALALSLAADGLPQLLTPEIVSTLRVPGSIVVLSGCASQRGRVLPGAGLIGLSRAWLLAGASAVVVSAWPTPDDSGRFFEAFYTGLRKQSNSSHSTAERTAAALRDAQLEMQRDPGYRRSPDYWAAYSVISKE